MEVLKYILLGMGVGGGYALAAQGMVLIYRGSGVINLAQGASVGVGAFSYFEFSSASVKWHPVVAVLLATLLGGLIGLAMHFLIMRPLRRATGMVRLIATTGVMTILSQVMLLRYEIGVRLMRPLFPRTPARLGDDLVISSDRLGILAVSCVLTVILASVYRFSRIGVATTALAESETVVAAQGWNPGLLAALNWFVGCAIAGLGGALLGPVISLTPFSSTLLVVPILAAALLGGFRSFPIAFFGGLALGVGQSLLTRYVTATGWSDALPFVIIVGILVVRGTALPLRSHVFERLPKVSDPRIRIRTVALLAVIVGVALQFLSYSWADAAIGSLCWAIVGLSVVVVTGFTGQLSLAQFALAGVGALAASRAVSVWHVSFWVGLALAIAVAVPVGLAVALPALRTRGVNLAIATLAMALVVEGVVLNNPDYTGGIEGTKVTPPRLFGFSLDPVAHPQRYAALCLAFFTVSALLVLNLRRGPGGRRLIAVRCNERAAAAMGINVMRTKLYGFEIGAVLASIGGVLLAFHSSQVLFDQYNVLISIQIVAVCVLAGVGYILGSVVGSLLAVGGIGAYVLSNYLPFGRYVFLAGGVGLIIAILQNPDGTIAGVSSRARRLSRRPPKPARRYSIPVVTELKVEPRRLEIRGVGAVFGGVRALDDVTFDVGPGEIVGLIGPNGSGKTTCLDIISGFTGGQGTVMIDGRDLSDASPAKRARNGLGRSFQALELFEDVTVWDNLATASESASRKRYGLDLVRPRPPMLSNAGAVAVDVFGLTPHLGAVPIQLPTGTRRILAIARAVASSPSILLLDEPAAGLDEHESAELGVLLRRVAKDWGIGVLLVEHDMSLVMDITDRLIVLDAGRIIAEGTPTEVAANKYVIEAYLGSFESDECLDEPSTLGKVSAT